MNPAVVLTTFVFGLLLGSFLFNVAERLMASEAFVKGRSKCPECGAFLKAKNLIPLISFLIQRGKCSYCQKKISAHYPISEMAMAGLAVLALYFSGLGNRFSLLGCLYFSYYLSVFSVFLIIFFTDLRYQLIPNAVLYAGLIIVVGFKVFVSVALLYRMRILLNSDKVGAYLASGDYFKLQVHSEVNMLLLDLLGALIIALFFACLVRITKGRGMGSGDIWLGFMLGLFNGLPLGFIAVFLGFIVGSFAGLTLIIAGKRKSKDTIAFGPFLLIGSICALLFGNEIFIWYIGLR